MNILDNSSKRNLAKLSNLAGVCNRYGVPNYAGAAIALTTMVHYAIITRDDRSEVVGSQKLGDERMEYGEWK